jgi:cell wall-associated NlpC family hydrolase
MTTMRTTSVRRPARSRGALLALLTGAGVLFTPLVAEASTPGGPPVAAPAAPVVAPNAVAQRAVDTALAQQGKPYAWGGSGPNSFDCSGLTSFAYKAAGIKLPRTSKAQAAVGTPVARNALKPGDLVFFYSPVSHVGIYIGGGKMVHAPTSGSVVKTVSVDAMGHFAGARRLA